MTHDIMSKFLVVVLALSSLSLVVAYYEKQKFRQICLSDQSNDDALYLNAQQLIERSGYKYEEHYSIADDGYVTLLLRIVNPLVERDDLRSPPVMLFHGANVDQTVYLMSSSSQHHPEAYPRHADELAPISSSNRSLGFVLANNGYDVWLVGQRGSNKFNMAKVSSFLYARSLGANFRPDEQMLASSKTKKYWTYGLDDIIAHEIRHQIDLVKRVTDSRQVSIVSLSLSAPTTMAFLVANEDYATQTRVYVQIAPAISADHMYSLDKLYFEKLCPKLPTRGIGFTPTFWVKPAVRRLIIKLSASTHLRYSTVLNFVNSLFGPSLKYNTLLERNVLAHIFQPVSFKSVQHYCQNSLTKQFAHFDYGKKKNTERYGQASAPLYRMSPLHVQNWLVVSGTNDGLADATTVARLIETTTARRPAVHVVAPGYNHLDMLAGIEVDKYVNLPILDELNKHSTIRRNALER